MHFNSRPHGGRRRKHRSECSFHAIKFQLTPSRRATIQSEPCRMEPIFQLTPSRRATTLCQAFRQSPVFQLTPSRRATFMLPPSFCGQEISTHALTEGDRSALVSFFAVRLFQLTPSRRATAEKFLLVRDIIFQLTPSRRATANLDKFFF